MSQDTAILNYLKKGKKLTPLDALHRFGCFRLSARVYDLRGRGHNIVSKTIQVSGKRVSEYSLVS